METRHDHRALGHATAVAESFVVAVGSASGTSTADTTATNTGGAQGTSDAPGVGASVSSAVGTASGTSSALGASYSVPINLLDAVTTVQTDIAIRQAATQPLVDFVPTHMVGPRIDLAGDWHLDADSGLNLGAIILTSSLGVRAMRLLENDSNQFRANANSHWSFGSSSFALGFAMMIYRNANGRFVLSNILGPSPLGSDLGFGISANADGGLGFIIRGADGNLAASSPIDVSDGVWRWYLFGYNQATNIGYLVCDDFSIQASGVVGNVSNVDARLATGSDYSGLDQAGTTCEIAKLISWEGSQAESIATYADAMIPSLQAELVPTADRSTAAARNRSLPWTYR